MAQSTAYLNEPSLRNLTPSELSRICSNDEDPAIRQLAGFVENNENKIDSLEAQYIEREAVLIDKNSDLDEKNAELQLKVSELEGRLKKIGELASA